MKIFRLSLTFSLVASICGVGTIQIAQAGPVGPSAKMAAQLKKYPTSKWLAHYLPDDRYKIAGGVWKYVSTDLDTYYHRPDSPLMMRQSPGRVIGFASAAEAEEAGYKPAPGTTDFGVSIVGGGSSIAGSGKRIVLSDGVSSVILPGGWSKAASSSQSIQGGLISADQLTGPNGEIVAVTIVTAPANAGVDMSQIASINFAKTMSNRLSQFVQSMQGMSQRNGSGAGAANLSRQFESMRKNQKFFKVTLSGISGVGITNSGTLVAGQPRKGYTVGRGRKLWSINDFSKSGKGVSAFVSTFQLR